MERAEFFLDQPQGHRALGDREMSVPTPDLGSGSLKRSLKLWNPDRLRHYHHSANCADGHLRSGQ